MTDRSSDNITFADEHKRAWQPREMRLTQEYLNKFHPDAQTMTRVRVGAPHPELLHQDMSEEELRMIRVWRRWIDALAIYPDRVYLIEAAIRPEPGDISKLDLYKRLFLQTEELKEHHGKRLHLVLVYAVEDPVIVVMAREQNIECVKFVPKWMPEYLDILMPRERRAPLGVL